MSDVSDVPAVPEGENGKTEMALKHPHGSEIEQVHRVITTDQGVDAWVLAEVIVGTLRSRTAARIERAMNIQTPSRCACPPESQRECGWRDGLGLAADVIRAGDWEPKS